MSRVPPPRLPAAQRSFEIDGSDDILAAALAAVEERERSRSARADGLSPTQGPLDLPELDAELDALGGGERQPLPAAPTYDGLEPAQSLPHSFSDSGPSLGPPVDSLADPESWGAALSGGDAPRPARSRSGLSAPGHGGSVSSLTRRRDDNPAPYAADYGDDSLGGHSTASRPTRETSHSGPPARGVGSPRAELDDLYDENTALRNELTSMRADLQALTAELREARRAEEAAHMGLQVAKEAAAEQAAEASAAQSGLAVAQEEQSKLKAAAQRLLREKRQAEDQLRRAHDRLTRAEDAKAAADQASLLSARTIAEQAEQRARLERDLERAHERRKRELEEQRRRESAKPLKELLPVLDHMQLALTHSEGEAHPLAAGMRMIADQLLRSLGKLGLELISAEPGSAFNPELHEALQRVETEDMPDGAIFAELQPGYVADGRLIRAARVSVAVRPRPAASEPAADAPDPGALPDDRDAPEASAGLDEDTFEIEALDFGALIDGDRDEGGASTRDDHEDNDDNDDDDDDDAQTAEVWPEPPAGFAAALPPSLSPLDDPTLDLPPDTFGEPPDPSRA